MIRQSKIIPVLGVCVLLVTLIFFFESGYGLSRSAPGLTEDGQRMDIFGDIMYLNEDGTRVVEGHLVIEREGMKLWADRGTYNEKKQYSTATGNVRVLMEETILTCGYLEFFMAENKSIARINPKIIRKFLEETLKEEEGAGATKSEAQGVNVSSGGKNTPRKKSGPQEKTAVMVGREIEIFHDENRVKAIGNAIVTQYVESTNAGSGATRAEGKSGSAGKSGESQKGGGKGPDPKGELKVTAEVIEIFTDINRLVAVRNVKIVNNDITATGNKAVYSDNDGILDIIGNARTWQNANLDSLAAGESGVGKGDGGNPADVGTVEDGKPSEAPTSESMVHINDLEGGHAEAERAVYNAREEVLDLIGSAKSWQEDGINMAQGDRIRYFLKDKRSVIIDARIKHYPGSEGGTVREAGPVKTKKKRSGADKSRKSAEEAALEALRALD